jgi:hypothetical protein
MVFFLNWVMGVRVSGSVHAPNRWLLWNDGGTKFEERWRGGVVKPWVEVDGGILITFRERPKV